MNPKTLQGQLMQKAFEKVLEEAKVPARHHLQLMKVLQKHVEEGKLDRAQWQTIVQKHEKHLATHEQHDKKHEEQISDYQKELERSRAIAKGEKGNNGKDGETGIQGERGINGKDGRNGRDGSDGKDAQVNEPKIISLVIDSLKKKPVLDMSHIKGAQTFLKDGITYKIEELMHGGGGGSTTGTSIYGEVVAGSGNTFTLANTPIAGTVRIYALGQRLVLTTDYTISGAVITTVASWSMGQIIADYNH